MTHQESKVVSWQDQSGNNEILARRKQSSVGVYQFLLLSGIAHDVHVF